jgi:hypothetical protein
VTPPGPGDAAPSELAVERALARRELGLWRAHALGDLGLAETALAECAALARARGVGTEAGLGRATEIGAEAARTRGLLRALVDAESQGAPALPRGAVDAARRARLVRAGAAERAERARAERAEREWAERERAERAERERAWRERVAGASARAEAIVARSLAGDRRARYRLALAAQGLDLEAARSIEGRLAAEVAERAPGWRRALAGAAHALGLDGLEPWDLWALDGALDARLVAETSVDADSGSATIAARLAGLGLAAPSRRDEPASGTGAAAYAIDPPGDVRVVLAVSPPSIAAWRREVHEAGHVADAVGRSVGAAASARGPDPSRAPALAPAWAWSVRAWDPPWAAEAVAEALVAQLERPAFLAALGLPAPLCRPMADAHAFAAELSLRLDLVRFRFELELAQAKAPPCVASASARYWALMAEHVEVVDPHGAPAWALVDDLALRPGRLATYARARLAVPALAASLGEIPVDEPRAAAGLRAWFATAQRNLAAPLTDSGS